MTRTRSTAEIKHFLNRYGHFNNPADPQDDDLDFDHITEDSPAFRKAVASYQRFMDRDFQRFAHRFHDRKGIADGEIGPATDALFGVERCGCADFALEATGQGSWPAGCHPDWPDNHAFTVNVNKAGMPSFLGNKDDPDSPFEQAWRLCRAAYANIGIVFIREDGNSRANTTVTWQRGAGWIGLAIVPSNPRCGDSIWAKFDNRYNPSALIDQWARLLAHEFGHNMGMGHSNGGIMNPSIIGGTFETDEWRGDPSEPKLDRFFGGDPVDLNPDPGPPPQPPEGDLRFNGEVEAFDADGNFLGSFQLTPTPPPIPG